MDSQRRSERLVWVIYAMLVVSVVALVVSLLSIQNEAHDNAARQAQTNRNLACTQAYDDAQYARSSFVQRYLFPKNDAQTALTLATINHDSAATIDRLRKAFVTASAAYAQAQMQNPLPLPPKLACGDHSPLIAPAPTIVPTPAPSTPGSPAPSRTPTPGTSVVPTSASRPVSAPGRSTVVRVVTSTPAPRTVTRTPRPSPRPSPSPTGLLPGLLCSIAGPPLCPKGQS